MRVYLDVCCLNRPFDDHEQDRVRIESEAVLTIIAHAELNDWRLLNSEAVEFEISRIPVADKRQKVVMLTTVLHTTVTIDNDVEKRAIELEEAGFKALDALHIACAEKGKADVLLTTDDSFLKKAVQNRKALKVPVKNPVIWLMEVLER